MAGLERLGPKLRVAVAFALGRVAARIEVVPGLRQLMRSGDAAVGAQIRPRLGEVEILHVHARRPDLRDVVPFQDVLAADPHRLVGGRELELLVSVLRLVLLHVVGDDELVRAVLVLEMVVGAFALQYAGDEVERRFQILDAVVVSDVQAGLDLVIREAGLVEDLFDDLPGGLFLEDARVGSLRQEPGPGNDLGAVEHHAALMPGIGEAGHEAVEVARLVALPAFEPDREIRAEHGVGVDLLVGRQKIELHLEQPTELLMVDHPSEGQLAVIAQRRRDADLSGLLSHVDCRVHHQSRLLLDQSIIRFDVPSRPILTRSAETSSSPFKVGSGGATCKRRSAPRTDP